MTRAALTEHTDDLKDKYPGRVKQYPNPYAKPKDVYSKAEYMLQAGVIEPACSDINSPIMLVTKEQQIFSGIRKLKVKTKFDTKTMVNIKDILAKLQDKERLVQKL